MALFVLGELFVNERRNSANFQFCSQFSRPHADVTQLDPSCHTFKSSTLKLSPLSGVDLGGGASDARPPFCHVTFRQFTKLKHCMSTSTTKKTDDYFQRESEQTAKKTKGEWKKFRFKKTPKTTVA